MDNINISVRFFIIFIVGFSQFIYFNDYVSADANPTNDKVLVCYYGTWAVYRPENGKFDVEQTDPHLCTHIIYAFAALRGGKIASYDPWNDLPDNWGKGAYQRFTNLTKKNPNLKVLLAIGGWNELSRKYSEMACTEANRKTFIDSAVKFLQKYGFHGLDLDWEYPGARDTTHPKDDKENYANLLKELREEFDKHGLLLTAAVSANKEIIEKGYDVPALSKYLDFIHVMCYDYHGGSWERKTGFNAPLFPRPEDKGQMFDFTVDESIKYWLEKGASKDKLVLGMPLYGRTFRLIDTSKNGLLVPASGPGAAGRWTREGGFLGYNEICLFLKTGNWPVIFDDYYQAPYTFKGNEWISYDDENSLRIKVEYLLSKGLRGAMVWSIETDDFRNLCGNGKNPLLNAIRDALKLGPVPNPLTTPKPLPTTPKNGSVTSSTEKPDPTTEPTVTGGPDVEVCPETGFVRDKLDCSIFYECSPGSAKSTFTQFRCANPTVFNMQTHACDWKDNVKDCEV